MKLGPHDLIKNSRWHFSQILKMLLRWRHGGHFVCLWMRHSQGCNFALIFFKIMDKEVWCLPMFAIENQLNRLITSGRKSGPRLQKIVSWFSSRCRRSVVRSPAGTKVLQLDSCYCCGNNSNWLLLYKKSKWLNILLTPWCSCFLFAYICLSRQSQILFLSDIGIFIVHVWWATQTRPRFNVPSEDDRTIFQPLFYSCCVIL